MASYSRNLVSIGRAIKPVRPISTSTIRPHGFALRPSLNQLSRSLHSRGPMSEVTVPLNDGTRIPVLAFGTGTALSRKDATELVGTAIASGFTHIDGAQAYFNEDSMGAAIAGAGKDRDSLYVVTKLWTLGEGETVTDSLKGSLQKLKLDYVDLFLVHVPTHYEGKLKELWKGMEEAKVAGLTKSIGVSNFRISHLEEILSVATIKPAVHQIEYHPYLLDWAEPIVEFGKKHDIVTSSYGGLTPIVRHKGGPVDAVLSAIQERLQKSSPEPVTEGQVLVKWLLQKGIIAITPVKLTSSKEERMKQYLSVPSLPALTSEEIQAIDEAGKQVHKRIFVRSTIYFAHFLNVTDFHQPEPMAREAVIAQNANHFTLQAEKCGWGTVTVLSLLYQHKRPTALNLLKNRSQNLCDYLKLLDRPLARVVHAITYNVPWLRV
ncbi:hypothetical protein JAAARDRAFT_173380 [Jaapia argillacea MUCL 33604]|uniref:NADP-dependent oxidoreductase domain-containing protein n=1 Tax=Jaapia argillacea MUCL 33604 TaxID=933084 RepID=A0A067Q1Z4_9AGAM|nr:hypothetical protein JAAARDRAFT_173380 [Jaapia argillacea MUCL 33604]